MLTIDVIIAAGAVVSLAAWPRSTGSAAACAAGACGLVALHGTGAARVALSATLPMLVYLTAALSIAGVAARSRLVESAASLLARQAKGSAFRLYCLLCLMAAASTMAVSLDGAVVLAAPVLVELRRRYGAPLAPLLLGLIAVANTVSVAVPQGNPTNLVLMERLGMSAGAFTAHLCVPALAAAVSAAAAVGLLERKRLERTVARPAVVSRVDRRGLRALVLLVTAAGAGWTASLVGMSPVWPFALVTIVSLALERRDARLIVPWRIAVQVGALLTILGTFTSGRGPFVGLGDVGMVGLAVAACLLSGLFNNLPASVAVAALPLAPGAAYGAIAGLSVGALATPHGSVATLIALDLADPDSRARVRIPLAVGGSVALAAAVAALAVVK